MLVWVPRASKKVPPWITHIEEIGHRIGSGTGSGLGGQGSRTLAIGNRVGFGIGCGWAWQKMSWARSLRSSKRAPAVQSKTATRSASTAALSSQKTQICLLLWPRLPKELPKELPKKRIEGKAGPKELPRVKMEESLAPRSSQI